MNTYILTST